MISAKPVMATNSLYNLSDQVKAFVADAKEAAADGLTVGEFSELAIALLRVVINTLDSIPADKPQKKQWAIDAVAMLFDTLADKCVPVVAWPIWMIVRSPVRQLVLLAAGGAVEALLPLVRAAQ